MNIGIIGSGIAGLSAGYLAKHNGCQVTIFESYPKRGMDANTLELENGGVVDIPLRIMNENAWVNVLSMAAHLGVETYRVRTGLSFSDMEGNTNLVTGSVGIGNVFFPYVPPRYLTQKNFSIISQIFRLRKETDHLETKVSGNGNGHHSQTTVEEYFTKNAYTPEFWKGFLLPILSTICTCKESHLLVWPAHDLLLLVNRLIHGSYSKRFRGGTKKLVDALSKGIEFKSGVRVGQIQQLNPANSTNPSNLTNPIIQTSSTHQPNSVSVKLESGEEYFFDRVIVATQANQTGFLDKSQFATELELLSGFPYDEGELVTHVDSTLLPKRKSDWSPINYRRDPISSETEFTVWVNPVEKSIQKDVNIFQTWNPKAPIRQELILSKLVLQRAIVKNTNFAFLKKLDDMLLDPNRRVYFSGSYSFAGVPLLESAVRSSMRIAKSLDWKVPW